MGQEYLLDLWKFRKGFNLVKKKPPNCCKIRHNIIMSVNCGAKILITHLMQNKFGTEVPSFLADEVNNTS